MILRALKAHLDQEGLVELLRSLVRCPSVTGGGVRRRSSWPAAAGLGAEWMSGPWMRRRSGRSGVPGARIRHRGECRGDAAGHGVRTALILTATRHGDAGPRTGGVTRPSWEVTSGNPVRARGLRHEGGSRPPRRARDIRRAGIRLQGTVALQSVIGEEDGGWGLRGAAAGAPGDAVIVCEPTRLA